MASISLDRISPKNISAIDSSTFLPLQTTTTRFSDSTLAKVESSKAVIPSSRPQLEPPQNYLWTLTSIQKGVEEMAEKQIRLFEIDLKHETTAIENLEKQKEEAFRKNVEEADKRQSWNILATVSEYIAGTSAIFVGAATGGWAGAALIASGSLGLGNRIIQDTVGWETLAAQVVKNNEELQKSLAQKIEIGAFHLSLGLGLAGGIGAHRAGAFALSQGAGFYSIDTLKKTGEILTASSKIAGSVGQVGESYATNKIEHLRADVKLIDAETTLKRQNTTELCNEAANVLDTVQSITEANKKMIKESELQL